MADQLATPGDLALMPGVDPGLRPETAALLIECATAVVQAVCGGQRLVQVVDDEVTLDLDGDDWGTYLRLPQRPVTAVSAVRVGSTVITDFVPQLSRARLWRASGWRSGLSGPRSQPSEVTVVYTHGYPADDQRLQLARSAVLSLAAGPASGATVGVAREQIDDYSVQYEAMAARMEASTFLAEALRRQYGRPTRSARLTREVAGRGR